jgi:hypothetical protein
VLTEALDDVTRLVLPILAERGYWHPSTEAKTLRERLDIPFKTNRYANKSRAYQSEDVAAK